MDRKTLLGAVIALLASIILSAPAAPRNEVSPVSLGTDGKLVYHRDQQGNRIPDFSYCGYAQGEKEIPNVPVRIVVSPSQGDNTRRIQRALDYVARLPLDTNGFRGAVLLLKGRYEIMGGVHLSASGVVLRGEGMGETGPILEATGLDRRTLLTIAGRNDRTTQSRKSWTIQDDYVPVGATRFHVEDATGMKPGDRMQVIRASTETWIDKLGMKEFGGGIGDWRLVWKPGSRDIAWDRVIKSVEGNLIAVDAPLTAALERDFGGGRVETYSWPGRLENVGIENLSCESAFNPANPKDEDHSWCAITIENAQNCWVRQVKTSHFCDSAVAVYESCRSVTVQDCLSLDPVSEEGGYRRHTFFTMGQLTLFLHCYAEHGRHDFAVGHCAPGPNAFVQCEAMKALGDSGPIESWASGVLYDGLSIDGNGITLANRGPSPGGAGWAAANSVLWQCSASSLRCANPPGAQNWAFGCWGEFEGNGIWRSSNEFVKPESLYLAQLADRLGSEIATRIKSMRRSTKEVSNPESDEAQKLVAASLKPALSLQDYVTAAASRDPIPVEPGVSKRIEDIEDKEALIEKSGAEISRVVRPIIITNGWLTCDGKLLIGGHTNVAWWRGNVRPADVLLAEPCLTRFVPGRYGAGFTDNLSELAETLVSHGIAALDHHYGLWYDRRRDDHERVRRQNGDVWPPFYELPFARSGVGAAWDGLSKYDLTKYNPWYWRRLKEFADRSDERGLVLFHQNYFQHNILEAGAHWADFPWRSANNINDTGFPEPPPYAGDKRIFMAEQFYDVSHPVRRKLHRAYIRQCLDNFKDNSNVIQFTGAEFTGPLHFVQFWFDTIAEWEKETGKKPLVALSCTKDVQDAILADPERIKVVDVIDFRYWWMTGKGTFAPQGGQNLAPRQFERQWRGGRPTDRNLAEMAAEYRAKYPAKPVICDSPQAGWAYLCAGGSIPNLPRTTHQKLLTAIFRMKPWPSAASNGSYVLAEPGQGYLIYADATAELDLTGETGIFQLRTVDLKTGEAAPARQVEGGRNLKLPTPGDSRVVFWLSRQP